MHLIQHVSWYTIKITGQKLTQFTGFIVHHICAASWASQSTSWAACDLPFR